MLGNRTKQINSYGRRQQRIINVSENLQLDSPSPKPKSPVEADSPTKPEHSSARIKRVHIPKTQPGATSPARPSLVKRTRAKPLDLEEKQLESAPTELRVHEDNNTLSSSRSPLSSVRINAPESPGVVSQLSRRKPLKKAPSGLRKTFDAFIDIEISLIDERGNVESKEHRISRPGIQTNPARIAGHAMASTLSGITDTSRPNKHSVNLDISSDEEQHLSSKQNPVKPQQNIPHPVLQPLVPSMKTRSKAAFTQRSTSPSLYPRQLTPIRRGTVFRHRQPSPTPSDISVGSSDLELEAIDIQIPHHTAPIPKHLIPLLSQCGQLESGPHEFSAFIETFPFDPVVHTGHGRTVEFHKIGEASYSEVFGIGDVVLKIIPLRDEERKTTRLRPGQDTPLASDAKDVLKEICATKVMGNTCPGFVELLRTYVVRGKYPELLLCLWDEFDEEKGSESVRPDCFTLAQTYAIIVLPNGGPDLENFTFPASNKTCWRQACSIFWQVARALSIGEDLVSFEHRDLHWGQILVKISGTGRKSRRSTNTPVFMDDPVHGVTATIIDLGLSRMDSNDQEMLLWTPIEEEVFLGEGDYQFDVYRMMRNHTSGVWQDFRPLTNVMWLHYLVLKLLKFKGLRAPVSRTTLATTQTQELEKECYNCLLETEKLLRKSVAPLKSSAPKKFSRGIDSPTSAMELVAYAVERQWISAQ